jgi:hypothetical protein
VDNFPWHNSFNGGFNPDLFSLPLIQVYSNPIMH